MAQIQAQALPATPSGQATPAAATPAGAGTPTGTPAGATPAPAAPAPPTVATPVPQAVAILPYPHEPMGFYTDTSVCIGCKACEVACKEWNQLSSTGGGVNTLSGDSYDNTRRLDGQHWRHVKFIEQFDEGTTNGRQGRWLMMSDVCKHCVQAPCLEVCPTGAIIRTEFDTVVIQSDVCNGCRDCIGACPFGVIEINPVTDTAMKCTLCYDRLQAGLVPACAQACPTASIQFGPIKELRGRANLRLDQLHHQGHAQARIYGDESMLGGLNSFYLLMDEPAVYGLPKHAALPSRHVAPSGALATLGAVALGVVGVASFRKRRMDGFAAEAGGEADDA